MLDGLFIASLVGSCVQAIKEACIPTIPAENWANKELYNKDIMDGVPIEQCLKNANNGKYKLAKAYPEPHRDASGKIVIENCELYYKDLQDFGAYQTHKWVEQGKYNLSKEELQKERERIEAKFEYLYSL